MIFDEYLAGRDHPPPPAAGPAAATPGATAPDDAAPDDAAHGFPRAPARVDGAPAVAVAERGVHVGGPFLGFWETFGRTLCGLPVSEELLVDGVRAQVFDNLVLVEHAPGRVRPAPLGASWLALAGAAAAAGRRAVETGPPVVDLVGRLATAPGPGPGYAHRPLADIRYLVVHHTGAPIEVGPERIAEEHVGALGWPGIGYHYVVGADGTIWRTQDLTTVSHHARQFNPVAVGIALVGDLTHAVPPAEQVDGAARLAAHLADALGLPLEAVRGHREIVPTACPGEAFLAVWKPRLIEAARARRRPMGASAAPPAPADAR